MRTRRPSALRGNYASPLQRRIYQVYAVLAAADPPHKTCRLKYEYAFLHPVPRASTPTEGGKWWVSVLARHATPDPDCPLDHGQEPLAPSRDRSHPSASPSPRATLLKTNARGYGSRPPGRPRARPLRPREPSRRQRTSCRDPRRRARRRGRPGSTPAPPPSTWLAGARPWSWSSARYAPRVASSRAAGRRATRRGGGAPRSTPGGVSSASETRTSKLMPGSTPASRPTMLTPSLTVVRHAGQTRRPPPRAITVNPGSQSEPRFQSPFFGTIRPQTVDL